MDDEKKYEVALIKHSPIVAEMPFVGFTAKQIDLFFGATYYLQGKGTNEVTVTFDEIRSLLEITRRGDRALFEELYETSKKFSEINLSEKTDTRFSRITPFIGMKGDLKKREFTFQAHPDYADAINDLDGSDGHRYTISDVKAIVKVNSTFSKQALKMLFLYRKRGYWYVTVEGLRYALSIPDSYKQHDIKRRVIEVIKKEFLESGVFEKFEIFEHKDEGKTTTGRKPVVGYTFYFKFKYNPEVDNYGDNELSITCPECGRPLYKKKRKSDGVMFWGHKDGHRKDAECRYTKTVVEINAHYSIEAVEKPGAGDASGGVNISKGDLERYYSYIREKEQEEASERRERVRKEDPVLWSYYEERERLTYDLVNYMGSMFLSPEGRAERDAIREEIKESNVRMEDALFERGYDKDYFNVRYRCYECKDCGVREDGSFCSCRKERAAEAVKWLEDRKKSSK